MLLVLHLHWNIYLCENKKGLKENLLFSVMKELWGYWCPSIQTSNFQKSKLKISYFGIWYQFFLYKTFPYKVFVHVEQIIYCVSSSPTLNRFNSFVFFRNAKNYSWMQFYICCGKMNFKWNFEICNYILTFKLQLQLLYNICKLYIYWQMKIMKLIYVNSPNSFLTYLTENSFIHSLELLFCARQILFQKVV